MEPTHAACDTEMKRDPFFSPSNQERLRHSFRQEQEGKLIRKTMAELENMERAE